MQCEHKFGFKKRDDTGGYYCPVCRATVILDKNGKELKLGK
jgi:hypothetical protein